MGSLFCTALYKWVWNCSNTLQRLKYFICLRTGRGVNFDKFITGSSLKLEASRTSTKKKLNAIHQLKSADHDYTAFFGCRNPVEKLLSIFDHFLARIKVNKSKGKLLPDAKFYDWTEFVHVVARYKLLQWGAKRIQHLLYSLLYSQCCIPFAPHCIFC